MGSRHSKAAFAHAAMLKKPYHGRPLLRNVVMLDRLPFLVGLRYVRAKRRNHFISFYLSDVDAGD